MPVGLKPVRNESVAIRRFAVLLVAGLAANVSTGADDIYLFIEGPDSLAVDPGETVEGSYTCILLHRGDGPGAEAWSFGVVADPTGEITGIRFEGTDAARRFQGGFEKSEIVTSGTGRQAAVSTVVLGPSPAVSLPANTRRSIAFITLELEHVPSEAWTALKYAEGLTPSQPPMTVTQAGEPRSVFEHSMYVRVDPPCFGASKVNVGFSARPVSSPVPYEGILGDGNGRDGEVVTYSPRGKAGSTHVYANIITDSIGPEGPQGWSLSVRFGGEGDMIAVTTSGTSVDKYIHEGFNITMLAQDVRGSSWRGAVSAVALSTTGFPAFLPGTGTESVLDMTIGSYPQEDYDLLATLQFEDGGIGRGQPVANVITMAGESASICNIDFARVNLRFKPLEEALFIRGNANGDSRVNISDAIWILNELFLSGPPCPCQEAADVDDDGVVNASDAVQIIQHQLLRGPEPAPPFPLCGSVPGEEENGIPCLEGHPVCD